MFAAIIIGIFIISVIYAHSRGVEKQNFPVSSLTTRRYGADQYVHDSLLNVTGKAAVL